MNEHVTNETPTEIAGNAGVLAEVAALRERLAALEESLPAAPPSQGPMREAKRRVWKRAGVRLAAGALLTVLAGATVVYGQDALALFIGPSGNVGIGTMSPVSRLTINKITTNDPKLDAALGEAPVTIVQPKSNVGDTEEPTATVDTLNLVREGVENKVWPGKVSLALGRFKPHDEADKDSKTQLDIKLTDGAFNAHNPIMTLLSDGKVGIGTTKPTVKLQVDGTVKVTDEILVGTTNVMEAINKLQIKVDTMNTTVMKAIQILNEMENVSLKLAGIEDNLDSRQRTDNFTTIMYSCGAERPNLVAIKFPISKKAVIFGKIAIDKNCKDVYGNGVNHLYQIPPDLCPVKQVTLAHRANSNQEIKMIGFPSAPCEIVLSPLNPDWPVVSVNRVYDTKD